MKIMRAMAATMVVWAMGCGAAADPSAVSVEEARAANVLPPTSHPYGHSYAEWGDLWWQWVFSLPVTGHPLFDTTGVDCARGQSGSVWFLGGTFAGSGPVTRRCTMPVGHAVFFPIVNAWADNIGVEPPVPVSTLREWAAWWAYPATSLNVTLDGAAVTAPERFHFASPDPFRYTLPEQDNILQHFGYQYAGAVYPAVSDGYWLMIPPLSAGEHVLRFQATVATSGVEIDVTYRLTVAPRR